MDKKEKNELLIQALKQKLMERRMKNSPSPMGETYEDDSMYGERGYEDAPELRAPADDMDGDFYNVVKKFSREQEMDDEEVEMPSPEESRYQQLLNLMNKGTKQ